VIRRILIACLVVAAIQLAARLPAHQPMPPTQPTTDPDLAASMTVLVRPPYPPLHKGHVDISTGLYFREDDDLVINTPFPIVLRRTYNSGDGHSRQFGINTTHLGEWWLYGDGDPRVPWADLILEDGRQIHFTRISPGNGQQDAVLRHDSTPSEFNGALLSWNGSTWEMQFPDGGLAVFLDCPSKRDVCSLVERRDPQGHRIAYVRDAWGKLLWMESEGQSIAFDHDSTGRIVRAYDTSRREVAYTYDDQGRLVRATGSDGIVRMYEYDDRNNLVGVREPGRILRNWYDDAGREVRQVVRRSEYDDDPYVATVKYVVEGGSVVESDFEEGDGLMVYRYNAQGYIVSETLDADGPAPIVFTYDVDPISNVSHGATMSCLGPSGRVTRAVHVSPRDGDSEAKDELIHESCLSRR